MTKGNKRGRTSEYKLMSRKLWEIEAHTLNARERKEGREGADNGGDRVLGQSDDQSDDKPSISKILRPPACRHPFPFTACRRRAMPKTARYIHGYAETLEIRGSIVGLTPRSARNPPLQQPHPLAPNEPFIRTALAFHGLDLNLSLPSACCSLLTLKRPLFITGIPSILLQHLSSTYKEWPVSCCSSSLHQLRDLQIYLRRAPGSSYQIPSFEFLV